MLSSSHLYQVSYLIHLYDITVNNSGLLIIPQNESGAIDGVIINALHDIPEEQRWIVEVETFVGELKKELMQDLRKVNFANKAMVGTYFSVKNPKNAMRFFRNYISMIDWSKSESLRQLFLPFNQLGEDK